MLKTSVWAWVVLLATLRDVSIVDASGGMPGTMMPTMMPTQCQPVDGGWSAIRVRVRARWGLVTSVYRRWCISPSPSCGGIYCGGPSSWIIRERGGCAVFIFWFWIYGDPHMSTNDGRNYTFNGLGEYTLVDALDGDFLVQGRTRKAVGSDGLETDATFLSAVACKTSTSSSVQVNHEEGGLQLYVDSEFIPEVYDLEVGEMLAFVDVVISKGTTGSIVAEFAPGGRLEFFETVDSLSMIMHLPSDYMGQTKGLMGVWNGDPDDDFTRPDGTVLSPNATDQEIYNWGLLWEITEEESIFHYGDQTYADFHNQDPSYVPIFEPTFDDPALEQEALEICGDNRECLFDASVTRNVTIGRGTMEAVDQFITITEDLLDSPPILDGPLSLDVTVGEVVTFAYNATDLRGELLTVVAENLPTGATFDASTGTVTWTVGDYDDLLPMTFTSTNSRGQTTSYVPQVNLCKCQNSGVCDFDTLAEGEDEDGNLRVVACLCPPAYTDQFCEDFNECMAGTDDCGENTVCVNDFGGYHCECVTGYYPNSGGKSCQDCPDGYRRYRDGCFRFWGGKNAKSYSGARQVCQQDGGDIYMWRDAAAVARLKIKLISDDSPSLWIGLSDEDLEGTWLWANGMALGGNDFTDWFPDPPVNTEEKDCAVARQAAQYRWRAARCNKPKAFICHAPRAP